MNQQRLILLGILLTVCLIVGLVLLSRLAARGRQPLRGSAGNEPDGLNELPDELSVEERESNARNLHRAKRKRKRDPTIEEQLFMAGRLSPAERLDFYRKQKLAPIVLGIVGAIIGVILGSLSITMISAGMGVMLGFYLPLRMLSGWIAKQHEELLYHLPLVIEQVAIGVSSSLDIGPCIAKIVEMADDRKSHNAVTWLLKYALMYVKSGVSLEEALVDIGRTSGHPEFKHAMLALSQVAKFGGEISKQLQDLADSVTTQREAKVEAMIRKLELKATGPVGLVFVAYMLLLGLGIASSIITKF
jgi:Flp pilus assembly protein TadB